MSASFNMEMDGRKSGWALKDDINQQYRATWSCWKLPSFMITADNKKDVQSETQAVSTVLVRSDKASRVEGKFILEILKDTAAQVQKSIMDLVPPKSEDRHWRDQDILEPYNTAKGWLEDPRLGLRSAFNKRQEADQELQKYTAPLPAVRQILEIYPRLPIRDLEINLHAISHHVNECYELFLDKSSTNQVASAVKSPQKRQYSRQASSTNQSSANGDFEKVAKMYAEGLDLEKVPLLAALGLVERLKASYAAKKGAMFAFRVAFEQLCLIKSRSPGGQVVWREIMDKSTIQPSIIRFMKKELQDA